MGASLLVPNDNHNMSHRPMRHVGRRYNRIEVLRRSLILCFVAITLFIPASLIGGALVYLLWSKKRPSNIGAIVMSIVGLTTMVLYSRYLTLGSPLFLLFGGSAHISASAIGASLIVQACGGFTLVCLVWLYLNLGKSSLVGHLRQEDKRENKRARSTSSNYDSSMGNSQISKDHPQGCIRLGVDRDSPKREIDLMPSELA